MAAIISSSLCCYASIRDVRVNGAARSASASPKFGIAFATGSPLLVQRQIYQRRAVCNSKSVTVRCEQSTKEGSGLDVWLERLAMVGFVAAISVEIAAGKGLLEDAFTLDVLEVPQGSGSGFVWDSQGHIVTNYYVIRGASDLKVTLSDQRTYDA
ncbi:hypothetical protein ACS0TY_005801 [Phlomoides rotata]